MTTVCMDCPAIITKGPRCLACKKSRRPEGKEWRQKRLIVYIRAQWRCNYCLNLIFLSEMVCDHIVPVSEGGTDNLYNLQALCVECHKEKTRREAAR